MSQKLCGFFELIAGDFCFPKKALFNIPRNGFSFTTRLLRFLVMINVIGSQSFLKNGDLCFELINPITKKDDFFIFAIDIHGCKPFQASLPNVSRNSGGKNSGLNNQLDHRVHDIDLLVQSLCLRSLFWKQKSLNDRIVTF